MAFHPNVWSQLKNLSKDDIIKALLKDGWHRDPSSKDATITFIKPANPCNKRVVIHYHRGEICGPKLLKSLFDDIGWNEDGLRRLKLIK